MFGKNDKKPVVDLEVFTIYDSKTESYKVPSFAINQHDLVRQITNMFEDPQQKNNQLLTNAEDFAIFKIGNFDRRTGVMQVTGCDHVVNLHELRTLVQNKNGAGGIVPT